jgi:hypothetical protein
MALDLYISLLMNMASHLPFTNNVFTSGKKKLSNTSIDPMGSGNYVGLIVCFRRK